MSKISERLWVAETYEQGDAPTHHVKTALNVMAAREIERLERELAECQAQAAAMRGLIEMARDELGVPGPEYPAPVTHAVEFINAALSSSAGAKVLRVVEAAQVVDESARGKGPRIDGQMSYYVVSNEAVEALREALAALGRAL